MEITSHSAPLVEQRGQIGKDRREASFTRRARLGCGLLLSEYTYQVGGRICCPWSTCPLKEGTMPNVRSHWASFQYIARKLPKGLAM